MAAFGLGAGTPSRFPYEGRPQPSPGVSPSQGTVVRATRIVVFGPGGGIFIYSGTPAPGNLIGSWASAAGTDPFGNSYPQGLNASVGAISGSIINAGTITTTQLGPGAVQAVNVAANQFGLNMVTDPTFSNAALNAIRAAAPTTGAWTFPANTAMVTQSNTTKVLYLSPAASLWVNSGEQYYVSVQVTASAATGVNVGIGIENTGLTASVDQVHAFAGAGSFTIAGVVTIPGGFGSTAFIRLFVVGSGANTATVTFSAPVCQPAILFSPTIEGTNWIASPTGQFFYTGLPAAGDLAASIVPGTVNVTDPEGNTARPGIAVYATSGTSFLQMLAGNPALLNVGTGDSAEATPAQFNARVVGSGATRYILSDLRAPRVTGENANAIGEIQLFSPTADLSIPPGVNIVANDGTNLAFVQVKPAGTVVLNGPFTSTAGTPAAPTLITTDTWNSLGALAAGSGYTVNNGRFQLCTDGRVEVDINLTAGAATVAGNYVFATVLPAGERPPFQCSYPLGWNGTTVAGVNTATLRVSTAGAVTLQLPVLPNGTVVSATQRIPTS